MLATKYTYLTFATTKMNMLLTNRLKLAVANVLKNNYQFEINPDEILISDTKPEFEGDYTLVTFPFSKPLSKKPDDLGQEIGSLLTEQNSWITGFNVIKGFLNLVIAEETFVHFLASSSAREIVQMEGRTEKIMIEYSSPNTNKFLHFGHLRNIFLGAAVSNLYKKCGFDVIKANLINDRGIHICKSMIAWQLFANGETPQSAGVKGDHFVGKYYVRFNEEHKKQTDELVAAGKPKEEAEKEAPIMKATQQMLLDWEAGKPDVIELWKTMNQWVYDGFAVTYKRIGSDFDITYYESSTYLLGKKIVQQGLDKNVFVKKDDGSIWIDLTADGLDEKIVQRKDGTSVYITQDIGLAEQKYEQYKIDQSIYVIGNEQDYHMKVLKLICQKLGVGNAAGIYHLSYGMVELTSGKMKSREGTVVDADDLVDEMVATSRQHTEDLGKVKDFTEEELKELYDMLALGAMKFYLLRVDPKKTMVFNPQESIEFHGFTGPFVQYTHARIKSILRKTANGQLPIANSEICEGLLPLEKSVIVSLEQYPTIIEQACNEHNPSVIANYVFHLAQTFNSFYTEHSVANAETEEKKTLRLQLSNMTANILKSGMQLLGIQVPERM